jgi:hypothetical protein
VLTAVAIVGIAGLTDQGESAACSATADAVRAAQAVHKANSGSYPTAFNQMTATTPPELEAAGGVTVNALTIDGDGWTITGTSGAGTAPMTMTADVTGCGLPAT